jgi:hypothetical protein
LRLQLERLPQCSEQPIGAGAPDGYLAIRTQSDWIRTIESSLLLVLHHSAAEKQE